MTRCVGRKDLSLLAQLPHKGYYASAFSHEQNAISAANFRDHVLQAQPFWDGDKTVPVPTHTIVIDADIKSGIQKVG